MATKHPLDLTQTIGDCGLFQVILTLTIHSATLLAGAGMMFMVFGSYNPGWKCLDDDVMSMTTYPMNRTGASRGLELNDYGPNDTEWTTHCDVKEGCRNLMYNLESSTVVTEWDLTCDLAWIPTVIISIQMAGVFVGSYVSGQIGDRYGRKINLYAYVACNGLCNLVALFSVSWQMYGAVIFITGFSLGGIISCTFTYPLEFLTEWWRGVLVSLPLWSIGSAFLAMTVYLIQDWRYVHVVLAGGNAIVFLTAFWTPESVRWLAVNGQVNKAKHVVTRIARINGKKPPDTQIIDDIAEEERSKMYGHKYNYLDLFRIRSVRGYSIKFGFIWITLAISYYIISFGITSLSGNFYLNLFLFSVCEIPGMVLVGPAVNRIGRRKASLTYFALTVVSAAALVAISFTTTAVKDQAILVLALACKTLIVSAWALFCLFSSELYPTVIRNLHMGYLNSIARIGGILAPYLVPNNSGSIYLPFLVIGVLITVDCVITWTLPESKGRVLEDSAHEIMLMSNTPETIVESKMHEITLSESNKSEPDKVEVKGLNPKQ